MTDLKRDMKRVQELVGNSFTATGSLVALADGGAMSDAKLQQTLEKTLGEFEASVLELRALSERHSPGAGGYGQRPVLPTQTITGHVEKLGYNWLHITLNTLLPHCRYQTPAWLTDTIRRLLDGYEARHNKLPYFQSGALLVIDEHCDIESRRVFDQDNKGWKAICNAIKGRLIPDDDQFTLSVALLSTHSRETTCHIYLLQRADAGDFFALMAGEYSLDSFSGHL